MYIEKNYTEIKYAHSRQPYSFKDLDQSWKYLLPLGKS